MKFSFRAKIYKVGINPCVKVPLRVTANLTANRGYIPVKGTIGSQTFKQNLVPVKDAPYRLYVNGPMLSGSGMRVGEVATFNIEQDSNPRARNPRMIPLLKRRLEEAGLMQAFTALAGSRKKVVLYYLRLLKTPESKERNIQKILKNLKSKAKRLLW
jgi:hypothetical protein